MDRFPEAFARFEEVVKVEKIKSFQELLTSFALWAGKKWKNTPLQRKALEIEAVRLGLLPPVPLEKYETQKRIVDELYRRVYYTYRRLKYHEQRLDEWESYYAKMEIADLQRWVLPRIESAKARRDRWLKAWSEAFERLKVERDILKGMEKELQKWRELRRRRG